VRVGIVSKWIASGQAVVARQIRSALEQLGHPTYVLARPGSGPRAARAASAADFADPAWNQPEVTEASDHEISLAEYEAWIRAKDLEVVLFDENYAFEEIRALREQGVRTVGRFVWEYFAPEHAGPAREAFETIYSLTRCERDRYAELGIESPYVQWGIHPELLGVDSGRDPELVSFWFPGSFLGRRKPVRKVVKAFSQAEGGELELVISAQLPRNDEFLHQAAAADPRIVLALEDEPEDEHRRRFASSHVCLAPSRWEGLGLPLYEATAFGLPIITNDKPPMSEMVLDGESGILVGSERNGEARSGIPAWDPDPAGLTAAIERLGRHEELDRFSEGVAKLREQRSWRHTVEGFGELLG
jgi:glycosyltransferase involved in cell wall biosynthesis